MPTSIILSFVGEGATDDRFIPNISERLIKQLLAEQNKAAAIIEWLSITKSGSNFIEVIQNAAIQAKPCATLIVHSDADDFSANTTMNNKIQPAVEAIKNYEKYACLNLTIAIPVFEMEAWMLVDKDLLREEMNTALSNNKLGLTYQLSGIESIADPKQKILNAIHAHHQSLPRKRRKRAVTIGELYEPLGQRITLEKLDVLQSFKKFKQSLIAAMQKAKFLN